MPIAPFVPLSKGVKSNLAFIRRGVREGLSSNEVERAIRRGGGSVGRGALQRAYRSILAQTDYGAVVNRMPSRLIPDPLSIPAAITRQLRQYSFTFRITGIQRFAGEEITRDVTVSLSNLETVDSMKDRARGMVLSESLERITSITATGGSIAGEAGAVFGEPII